MTGRDPMAMAEDLTASILALTCDQVNAELGASLGDDAGVDPAALLLAKTRALAACLSALAVRAMLDAGWGPPASGDFAADLAIAERWGASAAFPLPPAAWPESLRTRVARWYADLPAVGAASPPLAATYEAVLAYEPRLTAGRFVLAAEKGTRNRSGSYYTPQDLAEVTVRRVLDAAIARRFGLADASTRPAAVRDARAQLVPWVSALRTIDFTCGTGRFLVAAVHAVDATVLSACGLSPTERAAALQAFARGLAGVDVDPIALALARCEVALATGDPALLRATGPRFLHGNPLRHAPGADAATLRFALAASGFLHDARLGLAREVVAGLAPGGFDLVVGNPPWEKLRLEERSFFRPYAPAIAEAAKKDERSAAIAGLARSMPRLHQYYVTQGADLDDLKQSISADPTFAASAAGELNTNALFTELAARSLAADGSACLIVKSALVVSPANSRLFGFLLDRGLVSGCYDFINRERIFPIDSRERFAALFLGRGEAPGFAFASGLTAPRDLEPGCPAVRLDADLLRFLNPLTGMIPAVSTSDELAFLVRTAREHPTFGEAYPACKYGRLVHYTSHAADIVAVSAADTIPVYEGKFIEQYEGRFATYAGLPAAQRYGPKASASPIAPAARRDPHLVPEARYHIRQARWTRLTKHYPAPYSLMWRSLTSATNRRTCIATILPHMPASQSIQFLQLPDPRELAIVLAIFNSVPFDYIVRLKLAGIDLTQTIIKQVSVPGPAVFARRERFDGREATLRDHLLGRVATLLADDARLWSFCDAIRPAGWPSVPADQLDRPQVQLELDRLIARAYGLSEAEFAAILGGFLPASETSRKDPVKSGRGS